MPTKTKCEMCGTRFDSKRDSRRWKASAMPVIGAALDDMQRAAGAKPQPFIVCTDCFLELAESEYGVATPEPRAR